jgi:hypothetical protein
VEEDLDEEALAVQLPARWELAGPFGLRVDDGPHPAFAYGLAKAVRVVAGVADERLALRMGKQLVGGDHFVPLPRRERDVERAPFDVDDGVELG